MDDHHRPQNLSKHGKETPLDGVGEVGLHIPYTDGISLTARMTGHIPPASPSTGSNQHKIDRIGDLLFKYFHQHGWSRISMR